MSHRPGPWRVCDGGDCGDPLCDGVYHFDAEGNGWGIAYDTDGEYNPKVARANAVLIAAAPDLLEALEELRAAVLADGNHEPADVPAALRKAGAALNKARGAS